MKTYEVNVNGKVYQVGVKEIDETTYINKTQETTIDVAPAALVAEGSGVEITAPMPGVILKIAVNVGDPVKSGQILCLLEAMKMENEIVAPMDGVVSDILVKQGDKIEASTVLITL